MNVKPELLRVHGRSLALVSVFCESTCSMDGLLHVTDGLLHGMADTACDVGNMAGDGAGSLGTSEPSLGKTEGSETDVSPSSG